MLKFNVRFDKMKVYYSKGIYYNMGILEIFFTGIGLSMDALAVSVCKGLSIKKLRFNTAFMIAFFFGIFQAAMPLIGWLLGIRFKQYIETFDHWIAFGLLLFIGGKMLADSFKNDDPEVSKTNSCNESKINIKELTVLAVATSIDALAVGIAMACLEGGINIFATISVIGVTTFVLCLIGVFAGNRFGNHLEKNASIAGGTILILIGIKVLLEHLGILDRFFNWLTKLF